MSAELKAIGGTFAGQSFVLSGPKFLIGREQDCHLRPDNPLVSRHHCVLIQDAYTLRVRDLGSRNGTLVNGRRIQGEVVLANGDALVIGEMTFQVILDAPTSHAGSPGDTPEQAAERPTSVYDGNTLALGGKDTPAHQPPAAESPQPVPLPVVPPRGEVAR